MNSTQNEDELKQVFYRALRGKTVTPDQAAILEWAERRLIPELQALLAKAENRARIDELERLDTGRHYGKDYQESLDELDGYKDARLAELHHTPEDPEAAE